jgi:EAL domain-containing protein (putative c-di-GMP-specific phosphodiesterase class I)
VMERACCDIASRSPTLSVAVNVSAVEFRDGDVPASVRRALQSSGIDPTRLKVEITESTLMSRDRATLDQLEQIRALGIRISMDDFGTGYSSLSYLQSYTIDCIKIDQSFVRGLGLSNTSTAIVETIVRLARAMGVTTIAEGVETEQQLGMLRSIGCAEAQGFLLERPKRIDEIFPDEHAELENRDTSPLYEGDRANDIGGKSPRNPATQFQPELDEPAGLRPATTDAKAA